MIMPVKSSNSDGQRTTKIRQSIDVQSLASWMVEQDELIKLFFFNHSSSPNNNDLAHQLQDRLSIRQFGFGQSNPTYLLTIRNSTTKDVNSTATAIQLVLRRKPIKVAHPTSHALHREFRVLQSLTKYNEQLKLSSVSSKIDKSVPIPHPYAYCKDTSIIGSEFYIMQYVHGRIFVDPRMPTMSSKEERREAYCDAIRVMAVSMCNDIIRRVCIDPIYLYLTLSLLP